MPLGVDACAFGAPGKMRNVFLENASVTEESTHVHVGFACSGEPHGAGEPVRFFAPSDREGALVDRLSVPSEKGPAIAVFTGMLEPAPIALAGGFESMIVFAESGSLTIGDTVIRDGEALFVRGERDLVVESRAKLLVCAW